MNGPKPKKKKTPFDLKPGLSEFYSSQAELILAQFENIDRLLGRTDDWTAPGDYCEILFRECLRKFVPPAFSVDKGFFYGRATLAGDDKHSPEIDILIHDTQRYKPLFRMGDFVIVKPQAVRGMIQVKRTLTKAKLRLAINNVVDAKQHLLNVLWTENPQGWGRRNSGQPPHVFTAVMGFKNSMKNDPLYLQKYLLERNQKCRVYDRSGQRETNMYVLPSFIGSLKSHFLYLNPRCSYMNSNYLWYNSIHQPTNTNVCVQAFIDKFFQVFFAEEDERPPMSFPDGMGPLSGFSILEFGEPVFNQDDTVSITRNDKWKATYRAKDVVGSDVPHHFTYDPHGTWKPTALILHDVYPQLLCLQRNDKVERFDILINSTATS